MSLEYDQYLNEHISNVQAGAMWILDRMPELVNSVDIDKLTTNIWQHDRSKTSSEEYEPYDNYFYGNKSYDARKAFNYAWLHHIHNNPHHWQYWVLEQDDGPEKILEMPLEYIVEMVADWWSFSWRTGNLYEIFDWYEKHKDMKLGVSTRVMVEKILAKIKKELDKEKEKF